MRALVFRTALPRLLAGLAYTRITDRPAVFSGGPLALVEVPERALPGDRWVRVRSRQAGICGSDLHMLRLHISPKSSALVAPNSGKQKVTFLGHEAVGTVVEIGGGVRSLAVGQRVVMIPGTCCESMGIAEPCGYCCAGNYWLCVHRDESPAPGPLGGGWSEFFLSHESRLLTVPEEIPDETAVLMEPLACALHAVLRRAPASGNEVLVVGGGTIGLGIVAALKALRIDIRITVLTRYRFQSERALLLGADRTVGDAGGDPYEGLASVLGTKVLSRLNSNRILKDGFDVIYDSVGSAATLHHALRWCSPRATVVLVGVDLFPGVLDRSPLWYREAQIMGTVGQGDDEWEGRRCTTFQRVADWLRSGRLSIAHLVTHRYPFDDYRRAVNVAAQKASSHAIKVVLEFEGK